MIEHYAESLGLLKGLRVKDYESVTELETAANEQGACLRLANKYLVEKSALVDGRDKFGEELEKKTGFLMLTAKKTKADKTEVEEVIETEVQYINRFRREVLSGNFVHVAFPKDDKLLEEALQNFADSLGAFPADAKKPDRPRGKSKLPKWVMERVKVIFDNGTQLRWWDIMEKENIKLAPLSGARERDEVALAYAIREREQRREIEQSKQYE